MSKRLSLIWFDAAPDLKIYLTDPNRQTYYSADTSSQYGSVIEGKIGKVNVYDIDVHVEDVTNPAETNNCNANFGHNVSVDNQVQLIYSQVKKGFKANLHSK